MKTFILKKKFLVAEVTGILAIQWVWLVNGGQDGLH